MRLEILVEGEEPKVFPLKKSRILIGSHESCDILLEADGISRKHILILVEDDSYYVIDQGSANGSFINEERLVPGRKMEFTSFFPVKLASSVQLSLLSEDEGHVLSSFNIPVKESTSPSLDITKTTLSGHTSAHTRLDIKRPTNTVKKSIPKAVKAKQNDEKRMKTVFLLAAVLLGAAIYLNLFSQEEVPVTSQVLPSPEATPSAPTVAPVAKILLVDPADLLDSERVTGLFNEIKCTTDAEKFMCEKVLKLSGSSKWGAVQIGTMVNVLLDGTEYFSEAGEILKRAKNEDATNPDLLKLVATLLFIENNFKDLELNELKDYKLTFAFHAPKEEKMELLGLSAVMPESLLELKKKLTADLWKRARFYGPHPLKFAQEYLRVY
jgi:hypothetical protein